MTGLIGILLRASPAELGDLATRWGADYASPTIASLYRRITDESSLSLFLEALSADQRQLLSLVCRQRRGESSPNSLADGISCPDLPSLVESLLKAALLHRGLAGQIGVPTDLLPMLRRLLFGPTSGSPRPKTVRSQPTPREVPALKRAAAPATVRAASDTFLEHLSAASGRRAAGRRKTSPSEPDPILPSAAVHIIPASGQTADWSRSRAGRLASECAGGLGFLSEREGRRQVDSESVRSWVDLDGIQQAAAALEVWLSRRALSVAWPSGAAPFRTRQLVLLCMSDAREAEWYSSLSLLERARHYGLNFALRKASIRLARRVEANRIEAVLIDLHLFGCLDLGLDAAGRLVAFRLTSLGATLPSSHKRNLCAAGITSGSADA